MERVQRVVRQVEPHDSVERYTALGVVCVAGSARLLSPWEVEVDGPDGTRRLSARSLVIAAGARPFVPPIPGLDEVGYLTSDDIWSLRWTSMRAEKSPRCTRRVASVSRFTARLKPMISSSATGINAFC